MTHDTLGSDLRHVLVGLMDALAAAVAQSGGDRISEVARISGCQLLVGVGHGWRISRLREQIKNTAGHQARPLARARNRASFEAAFFLQALDALGVEVLRLKDD
jgi:hypothetical protein